MRIAYIVSLFVLQAFTIRGNAWWWPSDNSPENDSKNDKRQNMLQDYPLTTQPEQNTNRESNILPTKIPEPEFKSGQPEVTRHPYQLKTKEHIDFDEEPIGSGDVGNYFEIFTTHAPRITYNYVRKIERYNDRYVPVKTNKISSNITARRRKNIGNTNKHESERLLEQVSKTNVLVESSTVSIDRGRNAKQTQTKNEHGTATTTESPLDTLPPTQQTSGNGDLFKHKSTKEALLDTTGVPTNNNGPSIQQTSGNGDLLKHKSTKEPLLDTTGVSTIDSGPSTQQTNGNEHLELPKQGKANESVLDTTWTSANGSGPSAQQNTGNGNQDSLRRETTKDSLPETAEMSTNGSEPYTQQNNGNGNEKVLKQVTTKESLLNTTGISIKGSESSMQKKTGDGNEKLLKQGTTKEPLLNTTGMSINGSEPYTPKKTGNGNEESLRRGTTKESLSDTAEMSTNGSEPSTQQNTGGENEAIHKRGTTKGSLLDASRIYVISTLPFTQQTTGNGNGKLLEKDGSSEVFDDTQITTEVSHSSNWSYVSEIHDNNDNVFVNQYLPAILAAFGVVTVVIGIAVFMVNRRRRRKSERASRDLHRLIKNDCYGLEEYDMYSENIPM